MSRFSTICRRWYNTSIGKNAFPNARSNSGGLLLNSKHNNITKTLWKYFNAPGNLMFVTCNLVTFAGFVTINSMVASNRERLTEAKLLEAQSSLEVDVQNEEQESPLTEYSSSNFWCPAKSPPLATYDSQMAKMSLFHMLYAFYLYRDVLSAEENSKVRLPKDWKQEVEYLQDYTNNATVNCTHREMDNFYNEWKREFLQVFADLNKSQRFTLPTWKDYPKPLKIICSKLYHNDMEDIHAFADFYNEMPSLGVKRLLRRWLLDYTHLVSTTSSTADEKFYRQLLQDSKGDEVMFNTFASLLLNPADTRRTCFLPKQDLYQIQSASIDTVLLILKGYVHQREKMNKNHNGPIIRLLSMLKKDCVVGPGDQPKSKTVRIMLPTDDQRDLLEMTMTPQKRKRSLALISHHLEAIELLDSISKWNRPT